MSEIINVNSINPITFEFQEYSSNDTSLITSIDETVTFDSTRDIIEYFVYDLNNTLLFQNNRGWPRYKLIDNKLTLNVVEDLQSVGLTEGQYNVLYNFVSPLLSSNIDNVYFIKEISPDRTEIRLDTTIIPQSQVVESTSQLKSLIENSPLSYYDFYLNFGQNELTIANNVLLDNSTSNPTILIKLYEPLPTQFTVGTSCWVNSKVAESIAYNVEIQTVFTDTNENIQLKGPNFNLGIKDNINNSTPYTNLSTLSTTNSTQGSGSLLYQLHSVLAETGIEINVDYTDYSNFIHFSSALTRLENFYYKLKLIEDYSVNASLSTNINQYVSSSNVVWQNKIDEIITGFDEYEYFLYYESGSTSWPKTNSTPPYINASTTSSVAINWFTSQSIVAENYDSENNNMLVYTIPQYLQSDPSNEQYELFIEMIGQYFDTIFLYIKDITNKYNRDNRVNVGVSKELVADILRDLGVKIYQNNFSSNDLYSSLLGITPSGSLFNLPFTYDIFPAQTGFEYIQTYVTASVTGSLIPTEDINYETYKRIYANLPMLLKKKGTVEGLRALITLYGIPDTILRVNEFGGKDKNTNTWDYWQNEYNYTFSTSGSGFVNIPWDGNEFISLWNTSNTSAGSSTSTQIKLPLVSTGTYNMLVDWGDGSTDTITTWNQAETTHTYATAGIYTITIKGTCRGFRFANTGDRRKLLDISQYGILNLSTDSAFWGCDEFNSTAIDAPTISTTSFGRMFENCIKFNGVVNNWNVSNVTSMNQMFQNARIFNQPLNNWNTSNVTNMSWMFGEAREFNQDIGGWDVSNVTLMNSANAGMFYGINMKFNNGGSPSINNWDVSKITSFIDMFRGCSQFNQPIGNWNTSNVTNMLQTFTGCTNFNQDLGNWNVSKVTNFISTFQSCTNFNNGGSPLINNWSINTISNVNMISMFQGCTNFNQPIGNWNTLRVTNMQGMFRNCSQFNQPIGNWNTSNVTNMSGMFEVAFQFNQDISNWNVSNVTTMGSTNFGMFRNASSFNQNLGSWNLRLAGTSLQEIFRSSGMSCQNYTDTIVGWANYVAANSNTPINVNMDSQSGRRFDGTRSGGSGFASAAAARTFLTTATPTGAGWTISGDTLGAC
jgi:surface protein